MEAKEIDGAMIDITGKEKQKQLFHNAWLDVCPMTLPFEEIKFWHENYRTVLDFDLLVAELGKKLDKITLEEITRFLTGQPKLKIVQLAESIERNGVRVPLIILNDGILLDGNRRYFACSYLFHRSQERKLPRPDVLDKIPVWVIDTKDVDMRVRYKILAEANYVDDYKLKWPTGVKAQVIVEFFQGCIKERKMTKEKAYEEIKDVFGEDKTEVDAYIESIALADEFIESAPSGKKNEFREHVQGKFLHFWEFRNKALHGDAALDEKTELPKVKKLFFKMIETERFDNFKQVEPMIRAIRDEDIWDLLSSSQGTKIAQVEAIYKEQKAVRSAEDKIRNFLKWLQKKADPASFTKAALNHLRKLGEEISDILGKLQ